MYGWNGIYHDIMLLFHINSSFSEVSLGNFNDAVILVVQAGIYKFDTAAACDRGFFFFSGSE